MISQEPRRIYRKNPLAEVICQLRFPEIPRIETETPANFFENIRDILPCYLPQKEGIPGKQTNNHHFISADGNWRVNLTSKFISLSTVNYTCWEDFARMLDKSLAAFIPVYSPAFFQRIGLRYVNFISREKLGLADVPYRDLINTCYLGILSEDDVVESATARCSMDADTALRGGCRCKIHAGPGKVRKNGQEDPEVKFILDLDIYMPGNIPINHLTGALQTIHGQTTAFFGGP